MMNSDTYQDTAKPSSYLETENLETQEKVINLGKKLISSFQENDLDYITAWMINYLSEQILLAENGDEEAKKQCFNTIIQLWESRSVFPDGTRPFENFEPIFKALDSLSPETVMPRYFSNSYDGQENEQLGGSTSWVELAKHLDSAARTLITFIFEQAVEHAKNDNTKDWLQHVSGAVDSNEYQFIARFSDEIAPDKTEQRVQNLSNRIAKLEAFEKISKSIRQGLQEELRILEASRT
ncbi:hypothetical protein OPW33_13875 [Vibrio europaeus]|uniref:hypothetical protein n=1 Tax=Vibrio europaeus TaxID=300876 RepID=UPI0023426E5B|nr:hypothetical protein [Vibrio europaeus]MDC5840414.1 hypothetical protein [Vibrio europaeus]